MTLQTELPPIEPIQSSKPKTAHYIVIFVALFLLLAGEGVLLYRMYAKQPAPTSSPTRIAFVEPTTIPTQPAVTQSPVSPTTSVSGASAAPQSIVVDNIDSYFADVQKELDSL